MKLEKFKGFTNSITKEGMRALAIVLGVIVIIAGIVYAVNFGKRKESAIVPTKTLGEVTVAPQPTITPLIKETTSLASPSSIRKIQSPTGTQTSSVKKATVSPTLIK